MPLTRSKLLTPLPLMESSKLADLITARFNLQRSLLQIREAQRDCSLAVMELQIAEAKTDLAFTHHEQARNQLQSQKRALGDVDEQHD